MPPTLPDARKLATFVEVARRGSISAAARAMLLTPSAVSQQVSALEDECGVPLVERQHRGVALTGAGLELLKRAEEVVRLLEQTATAMSQLNGETAGRVQVGSIASGAAALLLPAITVLARSAPRVTMGVSTLEPSESLEALVAGSLDLAVIDVYDHVPVPMPTHLVAQEVLTESLVLVSSAEDDLPERPSLAAMHDREWVLPPANAACGLATRYACRSVGFEPMVRWETDDLLLLAAVVARGEGVALLPRRAAIDTVAAVKLRRLSDPDLRRRILTVVRADTAQRPILRACLAAIHHVGRIVGDGDPPLDGLAGRHAAPGRRTSGS
ncbi:LysR family transcriptional regulator [Pseudonocardia oroxyli]|uniref:LysR family transcriptional regulator n=1 Tax=Pseudonocardia oroxyli TaxID=366584 RepID=UPI0015A0B3C6|nr:LysR family transcriptional regulator [Pseudonocardia oroxyli]